MASSTKSPKQAERLAAALRENLKRRKAKARQVAAESASAASADIPQPAEEKPQKPI